MPPLIVLGWDALDHDLIHQNRLTDQFGPTSRIDTYSNPIVGEPHTFELWPSMITGQHADHHGIHAATDDDGVDWDNPLIQYAANTAAGIIPQRIRTEIGRHLRQRGIGVDPTPASYYHDNQLDTVFSDGGRAISIPNYETPYDRRHGLDGMRNDVWNRITPDRTVEDGIEPQVGLNTVWSTLTRAAGARVGHTLAAMQEGHDVVWTWFGLLDTIGHIQPAIDADLTTPGYQLAAHQTSLIRDAAPADATVIAVSDHGLQDGSHTEYATLATHHTQAHEAIDSVLDVADYIQAHRTGVREPPNAGYEAGEVAELTDDLEALGYV